MTTKTSPAKGVIYVASAILVIAIAANMMCNGQATAPPAAAAPDKAPADKGEDVVIVEVNGEKLTEAMLDEQAQKQLRAMTQGRPVPPQQIQMIMPRLRQQLEEQFVVTQLLKAEGARLEVTASDDDVAEAIAKLSGSLPPGMTLTDALSRENMTEDKLREQILTDLSIRKLLEQELPDDVAVSDEEIAAYYDSNKDQLASPESVHARHILIKTDEGADAAVKTAAKEKLEGIRKDLVGGADFAEAAKASSDCPSGKSGGDLGTFTRGRMVPEFENAAFTQEVNDIGPVIETKFGYHIVQVLEHKQAGTPTLAEKKGEISGRLKQQKEAENFNTYIGGLKEKATITRPDAAAEAPAAQ